MNNESPSIRGSARAHEEEQWFHGLLPREDINKLLIRDGDYLVRVSEPEPGMGMKTILSARWKDRNHHFVVNEKDGKVFIEKENFPCVLDMIEYYVREQKPVTESTGAVLITPVPKQDWEFKHEWIELGQKLGEGAFGGVYAGILTLENKKFEVAVKVNKASEVTKKIISEICKEARIMRRYRHPNVVKFYGVAIEHEPVMLVMEMVSGGSLDVHLQKEAAHITKRDRLRYSIGAAKGLEYLHENDCLHRDVAARNCLVHKGDVKLSDFGLSRELSNRAKKYKLKDMKQRLPIRWLAPEVLSSGTYSKKSDVYSFGILLWEIYTDGQMPYPDMSPAEVTACVTAGYRLSPPEKMPKSVRNIMTKRCFPGNPDDRSRMSEVRCALEDVLQPLS
ncbi:Non-specific protein-tyrosine kinase [Trichostrongylus colubriformis]|uniref:Tyrosine-protein kinase n=1 Tax=Trichostrongylus colubriformis TaxID=6319 RepID=A0AAN8FLK2_TRICO